jgi:hypothetical protein
MKPIVEYVMPGAPLLRVAGWFATKVDVEANIAHGYASSPTSCRTVRVPKSLLPDLLDKGKLYAFEALTKPRFGARFKHGGKWFLVCNEKDFEELRNNALEYATASDEERLSVSRRHVLRQLENPTK